jgi:hypothetical protein
MKTIEELYPDLVDNDDGYFWSTGNYQPMLESFGKIELQVDDKDYQGDSRLIYSDDNNRYGLLIFGWGSCSGCDALQACNNLQDIEQLRQRLSNSVKWYDTSQELLAYINEKDWELDYCWHAEETRDFVEKAKAMLADAKVEAKAKIEVEQPFQCDMGYGDCEERGYCNGDC